MKELIRKYIAVNSSMAFIFGLKMPIFYLMLIDKGFTLFHVGVLVTVTTVSAIVGEVPFGTLADRIGRKKVFLLGEFAAILATLGFWLSAQFEWMVLAMIINGVSKALVSGSLDALFVEQFNEVASPEEKPQFMAVQSRILAASALGLGVSTAIAGFLPIWFKGISEGNTWIGFYDVNFILMALLTTGHLIFTSFMIKESVIVKTMTKHRKLLSMGRLEEMKTFVRTATTFVRNSPLMLALFLLQFIIGATFMSLDNLWQPKLAELVDMKSETWLFGLLSSLSFFSMAAGQRLSAKLSTYFKNDYGRMLVAIQLVLTFAFICLANTSAISLFYILYMMMFLLSGLSMSPLLTLFHREVKEEQRSTMLSVRSMFHQGGATFGALAGGFVAANYGIGWAWALIACILLSSTVIYFHSSIRRSSKNIAAESVEFELKKA